MGKEHMADYVDVNGRQIRIRTPESRKLMKTAIFAGSQTHLPDIWEAKSIR